MPVNVPTFHRHGTAGGAVLCSFPLPKFNLTATVDPTTGDDEGDCYTCGSIWTNRNNGTSWVCVNAAVGAANWIEITAAGGGGGAPAGAGYIVDAASGGLSAERVITNSGNVQADFSTPGLVTFAVPSGTFLGATQAAGGDLSGNYPNPTVHRSSVSFSLTGIARQFTLGVTNYNDYAATDKSHALFSTNLGSVTLTGIAGGLDGRMMIVGPSASKDVFVLHEAAGSVAANRFDLPAGLTMSLRADHLGGHLFRWDDDADRWYPVGFAGVSVGGSVLGNYIELDDNTPAAGAGSRNVGWLTGGGDSRSVSAYVEEFGASGASASNGIVPAPPGVAGSVLYMCEDGTWSVPAGGGGGGSGDTDLTVNGGAVINFANLSDTAPAASTGYRLVKWQEGLTGDVSGQVANDAEYNQSTAAQGPGFAADTYVTGSDVTYTAGQLKAGTRYYLVLRLSKTAVGTAAPVVNLRIGTLGTTGDTSRMTFTFSAQTAAADEGVLEVWVTFTAVGGSAQVYGHARLTHRQSIAGLGNLVSQDVQGAAGATFSTAGTTRIGCSLNMGASANVTANNAASELRNLFV